MFPLYFIYPIFAHTLCGIALEKLAQKALETNADRVSGQYQEVLPDGKIARVRKLTKKHHRIQIPMLQGVIFRRSTFFENNLFFPEKDEYNSVYDTWLSYNFPIVEKNEGAFVTSTVYNYYVHSLSGWQEILKWNADRQYKMRCRPALLLTAQAVERTSDRLLMNEIMYWTTKGLYFAIILDVYRFLPQDEAKQFYQQLHKTIMEILPNYSKNPLIWRPFRNSDDLIGVIACAVLVLVEKMRMQCLLPLISCVFSYKAGARKAT